MFACSSSSLKHCCSLCKAQKQVVKTKECSKGATNKFSHASVERCMGGGRGGVSEPRLFLGLALVFVLDTTLHVVQCSFSFHGD